MLSLSTRWVGATDGRKCPQIKWPTSMMAKASSICVFLQQTSLDWAQTPSVCSDNLLARSKSNNRDNPRHSPRTWDLHQDLYLQMVGRWPSGQFPSSPPPVRLATILSTAPFRAIGSIKRQFTIRPRGSWTILVSQGLHCLLLKGFRRVEHPGLTHLQIDSF